MYRILDNPPAAPWDRVPAGVRDPSREKMLDGPPVY
jgi:hypothetical protein